MGSHQHRRIEELLFWELGLLVILGLLAAVQVTLLPRPFGSPPNILLLLIICQALLVGPASAARWAFYGGLAMDIAGATPFGSHALALLAAVLAAALPLARMSQSNWMLPLLGVLFGATAYHGVLALLTSILVTPIDPRNWALTVCLPEVLFVLIPALPLYLFLRWIHARRHGEVPIDVY